MWQGPTHYPWLDVFGYIRASLWNITRKHISRLLQFLPSGSCLNFHIKFSQQCSVMWRYKPIKNHPSHILLLDMEFTTAMEIKHHWFNTTIFMCLPSTYNCFLSCASSFPFSHFWIFFPYIHKLLSHGLYTLFCTHTFLYLALWDLYSMILW